MAASSKLMIVEAERRFLGDSKRSKMTARRGHPALSCQP
jgi:hypothetical protein